MAFDLLRKIQKMKISFRRNSQITQRKNKMRLSLVLPSGFSLKGGSYDGLLVTSGPIVTDRSSFGVVN